LSLTEASLLIVAPSIEPWLRRAPRYLYVEDLLYGARVLEIGCGPGTGADFVAQRHAARVVGVDLSGDAIARARLLYRRPNLEFEQVVDYAAQAFRDGSFDLVLVPEASELLYLDGFVDEIHRLLTPSGHALIGVTAEMGASATGEPPVEVKELLAHAGAALGQGVMVIQRLLMGYALTPSQPGGGSSLRYDGSLAGGAIITNYLALHGPTATKPRGLDLVELPVTVASTASGITVAAPPKPAIERPDPQLTERLARAEQEIGRVVADAAVEIKGLRSQRQELETALVAARESEERARHDLLALRAEREAARRERDEVMAERDRLASARDAEEDTLETLSQERDVLAARVAELTQARELAEALAPVTSRAPEGSAPEASSEPASQGLAATPATAPVPAPVPFPLEGAYDLACQAVADHAESVAEARAAERAEAEARLQAAQWEKQEVEARLLRALQKADEAAHIAQGEVASWRGRGEEAEGAWRARQAALTELQDSAQRALEDLTRAQSMLADADADAAEARAERHEEALRREAAELAARDATERAERATLAQREAQKELALAQGELLRLRPPGGVPEPAGPDGGVSGGANGAGSLGAEIKIAALEKRVAKAEDEAAAAREDAARRLADATTQAQARLGRALEEAARNLAKAREAEAREARVRQAAEKDLEQARQALDQRNGTTVGAAGLNLDRVRERIEELEHSLREEEDRLEALERELRTELVPDGAVAAAAEGGES
jgi:SAM-dependent methyltransferase